MRGVYGVALALAAGLVILVGFLLPPTIDDQRAACYQKSDRGLELDYYLKIIDACTARIKSGQEPKEALIAAYESRAAADVMAEKKGQALADYGEAIRLGTNKAESFFQRGLLNDRGGNKERAAEDFGEALKREPSLQ